MTGATDWTGRVGDVWAQEWRRTDRSFADLAPHLDAAILAAAPGGAFTALDIGCGAGATAAALASRRPDAQVIGVDLSSPLLDVTRARFAGHANLHLRHGDALAAVERAAPLDLLCSRHGVMFFPDPAAAFARLHAASRAGTALVFSCFAGIDDNPWATLLADPPPATEAYSPGPFAFADPRWTTALLEEAGWRSAAPRLIRFSYIVGGGDDPIADAAAFLSRIGPAARLLRDADGAARQALLDRLHRRLAAQRNGATIAFPAAAWIWTARATGERP